MCNMCISTKEVMDIRTRKIFEGERDRLCGQLSHVVKSHLYINFKAKVAVIGIQTLSIWGGGFSNKIDYIFLAQERYNEVYTKLVLQKTFDRGEMFPTGISTDGTRFFYKVRKDIADLRKKAMKIKPIVLLGD